MDIDGLRVLITRPAGRADDLVRAIAGAGGGAVHIPLLTVAPLDPQRDAEVWQHTDRCVQGLAHYRRVIAISVNAVQQGLARIAAAWSLPDAAPTKGAQPEPSRPPLPRDILWYGIGAATIAEFARAGIAARGGSAGATSEALLALPELQAVRGEAILILRGVGGRETLAEALRGRGASVDYAECYRRAAPQLDDSQQRLLQAAAFDAICVNSAETLQNLWHYLQSMTLQSADAAAALQSRYRCIALIVPSERVAAVAAQLGFASVTVAANAGTAATVAALRDIAARTDYRNRFRADRNL